ncbi:aminotransferase class I/II-fold pyridoxal phosphate-dependent enzyme [Christensenella timonensis]|uniref:aminotransferase class I/II-fold pyridoxal phosphate-dependent enzyme n=1 Tax=Christensenella timonensis TaxID=1816678 RepID=UPI000A8E33C4|nr:aminotransferase class I/II-fold pyridoxal phosphate-dependent enzyme [Christensenella timonensis]
MRKFIAKTVEEMPPSGIRKFFDIASEMKDIISLSVGEPDFVTPWNVREAAISSIERGYTHYTSNHGNPALRKLITKYLCERYGIGYDWQLQTIVTVGASEALDLAFRSIIEPGDEILVPAPSYVSYMPGVSFAGGVAVPIETKECDNFTVTPQALENAITSKTKAIILPYPNNPTGAIMTKEQLEAITGIVEKHDLFVISDEIYSELTYGGRHCSIASFPNMYGRTVVINGFSKAFAMTGFRLGYAAGPEDMIAAMVKIHQYFMLCAPTASQHAGEEALRHEMDTDFAQVSKMVADYNRRRTFVYNSFQKMGLSCFEPRGAFYVFPNISGMGMTSEEFCHKLISEKHVACVPGTAFGAAGEGFMRCSYASSMENLKEAVRRIAEFVEKCRR